MSVDISFCSVVRNIALIIDDATWMHYAEPTRLDQLGKKPHKYSPAKCNEK